MDELRLILTKKYGNAIVSELLTSDGRVLKDKRKKNGDGQQQVKTHMRALESDGVLGSISYDDTIDWAFDFPSWLGQFNKGEKKVMVVGLEPHIQQNDYQLTYGFGETSTGESNFDHFIWHRLSSLFFPSTEFKQALHKFYITDLCHFAPKGNANLINNIANWSQIRSNVAKRFLKDEIDAVDPEIIMAQGGEVFKFLKAALGFTSISERIETGYKRPRTYKISIGEFEGKLIIGVPHIGSEHNLVHNFWQNKLDQVREVIQRHSEQITDTSIATGE